MGSKITFTTGIFFLLIAVATGVIFNNLYFLLQFIRITNFKYSLKNFYGYKMNIIIPALFAVVGFGTLRI